jgi:CubicO group peptidase (beta-lactamase class C family)
MKFPKDRKKIARYILPIFVILTFFYTYSTASVDYYPTEGWRMSAPEEQGMNSKILTDMIISIQRNSYHIDNVSIVRNGYMVVDAYFYPFSKDQKHIIHSCTKSIMSALIGIAIDQGYIKKINQPIVEIFSDRDILNLNELKKSITLENLLTMASGLKCRDSYLYGWVGLQEMKDSNDWAQYVLDLPMVEVPGEKFEYCNGVSYLLSVIIQQSTNMKTLEFASKNLFGPLGITDVGWRTSPQGIDIGWGEMWLKAHDMAKIGWLYLNKGRWENKQIVPTAWVKQSTRGHIDATLFDQYGYQWWIDSAGFYMAVGYKGQFIFVVPDKNMVAVFTSDLPGADFPIPRYLLTEYIIPAAASSEPLPNNPEEKARLDDIQVSIAKAPTQGFVWTSEKEGVAKEGIFKRTTPPNFQFKYPLGSKKAATEAPGQVVRMTTPAGVRFSASVGDIPEGIGLEDFGKNYYAPALQNVGSNIQVISNNKISLKCGTVAYRTDIEWLWNNSLKITSLVVSAYKDGKFVFVAAHPWQYIEEVAPLLESLQLK